MERGRYGFRSFYEFLWTYALFLVAWHLVSLSVSPFVLPSPADTLSKVVEILSRWSYAHHILLTIYRTVLGVAVSAVVGIALVMAAKYVGPVQVFFLRLFYPAVRAIPVLAIALITIVWFKLGTFSVAFVILISVLPIYLVELWEGVKVVDSPLVEMAHSITRRKLRVFSHIIIPMTVPRVFAATKLGFAVGFKLSLVGEMLAATDGIGFEMYQNIQENKTEQLFAWAILVVVLVIFFEHRFFDLIENRLLHRWRT